MDADQSPDAVKGRSDLIAGVTIAFLSIAWIAVSMRTYVRLFMIKNYGWDDAVMLLAAVSHTQGWTAATMMLIGMQITFTMYSVFNLLLVSYGFGNPSLLVAGPAVLAKVATVS